MIRTLARVGSGLDVIELPISSQCLCSTALLYMCSHDIRPYRGCHWFLTTDASDVFLLVALAFRANAFGVYSHLEKLGADPKPDWDAYCRNGVAGLRFWEHCRNGFPALEAVDNVPWEIHQIPERTAYIAALEAYDRARL